MTKKEMLREFGRGITILKNKNVAVAFVVRIINQLSLFGLVVFLPHVYTADFGFTTSEWLRVWGLMYIITIFTNLFWGIMGDKIGWVRQVRWFGCIGMAVSTLAFYYFPAWSGPNIFVTTLIALMFGFAVAAFVPMSAIFPTLVPEHKGAAVSVHNLAAGLSNFLGYGLASVMLIFASAEVTIWAYAVIYVLGFVLTFFMKVQQPGRQVKQQLIHNQIKRMMKMTNIIDQFKVNGKVAIVTGGAMGLGKAMAEALAQAGADIVIADIKLDLAQETAKAIADNEGVKTTALKVDVTNPEDVSKMVNDVVNEYGKVDILVNNAGMTINEKAEDVSYENWLK